jgi:hypothetical protein
VNPETVKDSSHDSLLTVKAISTEEAIIGCYGANIVNNRSTNTDREICVCYKYLGWEGLSN